MRTLIVGAGTMGRWFAELTAEWVDPIFLDSDEQKARKTAREFGGSAHIETDVDSVPIVCTAVPLSVTPAIIREYAPVANRAVIDLSGAMKAPTEAMRSHAPDCERISLHPLFAPENAPGNVAVVAEEIGPVWGRLSNSLELAGNDVFETSAETHDRAMETVQAKVHAAVIAYAVAADDIDSRFHTPVSAELSALADMVLSGNPSVYAEIQEHFDGAEDVARAAETIAEANREDFEDLYRTTAREFQWERDERG